MQGRIDVAVALAGATGGLVVAAAGYGTLAMLSGVLSVVALGIALRR